MDTNLLKVFVAVSNSKSISLGAKELDYTQSNATLRVKQLEKSLGYELFHRTNRGVVLTLEGEKFYPYAVEILKKIEEATLKIKNINYQEYLKIGSTQSNSTIRLTNFFEKINAMFPDMKLEFVVDSSLNLIEQLLDYKVDIAFVNGKPNHKDVEILNRFNEDIVLVEPKDKTADNKIYSYKKGCLNCILLEKHLMKEKQKIYKKINLENYELILSCVKAGFGVSIFSREIIKKFAYEDKLKLTKMNFDLDTYLICRKDYIPLIENWLRKIQL